eukprot:s1574_g5.t1
MQLKLKYQSDDRHASRELQLYGWRQRQAAARSERHDTASVTEAVHAIADPANPHAPRAPLKPHVLVGFIRRTRQKVRAQDDEAPTASFSHSCSDCEYRNDQYASLQQELPRFLEQSAVPVLAFLGVSFLVALLSRQFLRVVTVWRKNEEERKAEKVRKIQTARFNKFTSNLQNSLEDLAKGRLAKAAKGFDELAAFADRWASEPTWEDTKIDLWADRNGLQGEKTEP